MTDQTPITRTERNSHLDELPGVGEHQPHWTDIECPDCDGHCWGHPDVLVCKECDVDWPCSVAQAVIDEVEKLADGLCCGAPLWFRANQLRGVA